MALAKKIKHALNYLTQAYKGGHISYPRVDNNFIVEAKSFDLFPHPALSPINKLLSPFKNRKKIKVNKEEIILFLSTLHIISPAQIEGVSVYLDYYLDDNLIPHSAELEEEIKIIIEAYEELIRQEGLKDTELLQLKNEFYQSSRKENKSALLFSQESFNFYPIGENTKIDSSYWIREKNKSADPDSVRGGIIEAMSISDTISQYQEHNKTENQLQPKRN